jgi:hypothetical protein
MFYELRYMDGIQYYAIIDQFGTTVTRRNSLEEVLSSFPGCKNIATQWEIERKIVLYLIRTMKVEGWTVTNIFDGSDFFHPRTDMEVLDIVFGSPTILCSIMTFENNEFYGHSHSVELESRQDRWDIFNSYSGVYEVPDGFGTTFEEKVLPYAASFDALS